MIPRRIVLARPFEGAPKPEDFALADDAIVAPGDGEVSARVIALSLDPYLRGAIAGRHMGETAVPVGGQIPGRALAQVTESRAEGLAPGDLVVGETGWRTHATAPADSLRKVDARVRPATAHLGALGMPGLTAWAGVAKLLDVKAGETFVVSAATGGVGSVAGQIAAMRGGRAVGIAGGPEKCRIAVERFGFADCVDYRAADFPARLKAACPNGIHAYFDNAGGDVLQQALLQLAIGGRVVLCGLMAQYNGDAPPAAINAGLLIGKRATVKGLVVYDFYGEQEAFAATAARWLAAGTLKILEDRVRGLEAAPEAFARLMRGGNVGKALVMVGEEPT